MPYGPGPTGPDALTFHIRTATSRSRRCLRCGAFTLTGRRPAPAALQVPLHDGGFLALGVHLGQLPDQLGPANRFSSTRRAAIFSGDDTIPLPNGATPCPGSWEPRRSRHGRSGKPPSGFRSCRPGAVTRRRSLTSPRPCSRHSPEPAGPLSSRDGGSAATIDRFRSLPTERCPRLIEVAGAARSSTPETEFRRGLSALLDGLRAG